MFLALSYSTGFMIMITPNLYLEYLGKENVRSEFCLAPIKVSDQVTSFTLCAILAFVTTLMLVFKVIQPSDGNFWFSLKSSYWWPNLVLAGALVVYQFSQALIMNLFIFPLI